MSDVSIRELRNHGGEVVDRVARGERLTVTRNGRPVAELRPVASARVDVRELVRRRSHLPPVEPDRLRQDIDSVVDPTVTNSDLQTGILDTSVLLLLGRLDPDLLPEEPLITAVTLAELSVGPLVVSSESERAARQAHLQAAEADFDPLPFDAAAARSFGLVAASLRRAGD